MLTYTDAVKPFMIPYFLFTLTLAIGLISLLLLYRASRYKWQESWALLLLSISMAGFISLYGAWFYVSVKLKTAFEVIFIIYLVYSLIRGRKQAPKISAAGKAGSLSGSLVAGSLIVLYFTGTTGTPHFADLQFPLKHGDYFVMQGGKGLPTNLFHYNSRKAVFAMDLIRLNNAGERARHIFSKKLEDYFIFGDTVFSPCAGTVMRAMDDNPDNTPPERKRGPHNLNGVLIEADKFYVFLGHLKYRSVFVKAGDTVASGTPLGIAGNSGFSIEPHLHIQAHIKLDNGKNWYEQEQLFIRFSGREYLLFQTIQAD